MKKFSTSSLVNQYQNNHSELEKLGSFFPKTLYYSYKGHRVIKVTPDQLIPICTFLKKHTRTQYSQLRDITVVDRPERKFRFEVIYNFLSLKTARRVCVSVSIPEGFSLPSVTSLYPAAGWFEREAWDRFGVFFRNHPDLRRRLTDYGFKGHPLRKDFPVTGFVEVRYDDFRKRILYEELSLAQDYRIFTLDNPWKSLKTNN